MKKNEVFEKLYFVMCDFMDEFGDKINDEGDLMNEMICFLCENFEESFDFKKSFFED